MSKGLSKSKYTLFRKCEKCLWLTVHHPELQEVPEDVKQRFLEGNIVGEYAQGLFGEHVDVTTYAPTMDHDGRILYDENGHELQHLDLGVMCAKTRLEIARGTKVICEAAFSHEGNYCAVDLLVKKDDGYTIYEVKSVSQDGDTDKPSKEHLDTYAKDIAYQKWILTQCGVNVIGTHLVFINRDYVREGDIDPKKMFLTTDMSDLVNREYGRVEKDISAAKAVLTGEEPQCKMSLACLKPYGCAFWNYCKKLHNVPENEITIFDAYHLGAEKKMEHFNNGKVLFTDMAGECFELNKKGEPNSYEVLRQMHLACHLSGEPHIDKEGIRSFLTDITYPVYHLDFETIKSPVPMFDYSHPNEQIPTQYSLHIEHADHTLEHKEFLAESGVDPRRAIAEALCRDIPADVCVTAYNKTFECGRLAELAELFPDLHDHLMSIRDHIVDLLVPFRAGYYYTTDMHCGYSIKKVLPALWPNEPSLDYHNLAGTVHNGGEAMNIFPRIQYMTPEDQAAARHSLLIYCELDTFAMVKVLEKLREVSK